MDRLTIVGGERERQRIQQGLLANDTFEQDLSGFAASAAASDLLAQWATYNLPIDAEAKRGDVDDVIKALKTWRDTIHD